MPVAPSTIANPRPSSRTRRARRWRGALFGLAAMLANAGPSLSADLQYQLLGDWYQAFTGGFLLISFSPDGRIESASYNAFHAEALVTEARYILSGPLLTLGVGDTGGGDAWNFGASSLTCSVAISHERLELSNCAGWSTGAQAIALPDAVWVRSRPALPARN